MANGNTFYVIQVHSGVEPELAGPYESPEAQLDAAREFRNRDGSEDNLSFWLDVSPSGIPEVGSFSGGQMEPDYDPHAA